MNYKPLGREGKETKEESVAGKVRNMEGCGLVKLR